MHLQFSPNSNLILYMPLFGADLNFRSAPNKGMYGIKFKFLRSTFDRLLDKAVSIHVFGFSSKVLMSTSTIDCCLSVGTLDLSHWHQIELLGTIFQWYKNLVSV